MRKIFLISILLYCVACLLAAKQIPVADYHVVPLPNQIALNYEKPFLLSGSIKIVYPKDNKKMQRNATFLANYLKDINGKTVVTTTKGGGKSIVLKVGLNASNQDAYTISVTSKQILINGASESGVFYGIQTLRKSLPEGEGTVSFPAVDIQDEPRFLYRGMHLDVSRHFYTVEEVKSYLDMLALHNVNNFHWHLTDDQGWRIEIKKYPLLTEIGSYRPETVVRYNTGTYDGIPHSGFYTQEQIKEVVAYAEERFINVIPEIDMPGHMMSALAAYPELGCTGGPYEVWRIWGVSEDVLCMGNDKTFTFIKDVLNEVMELFPSKYIHIGGDECPKNQWKECPKCQLRIRELGLIYDDLYTAEEQLQSYFISYAEKVVNEKGRKIIGWDEILDGGLASNATVMSWRGMVGGIEAAKLHHDVIMTPDQYVYFDYYQTQDIENEPFGPGGLVTVKTVYDWEPVPAFLNDEQKKYIIGAQANVWCEYISTLSHVQYMALPRMAALCEVQWTNPSKKNYDEFLKRLPRLLNLYSLYKYNFANHLLDIGDDYTVNTTDGTLDVHLTTLDDAQILYTLDGTTPTLYSLVFNDLLHINETCTLKALIFRDGDTSRLLTQPISFNLATLKPITSLKPLDIIYALKGINTLVDGLTGSLNYSNGRWVSFYGNDLEVVIDLQAVKPIQSVSLNTIVNSDDWIFDCREMVVEVSEDAVNYTGVASETYPAAERPQRKWNDINTHKLSFNAVKTRYVKVKATSEKFIPEWHVGRGHASFMFVDEISIE